MNPQQLSPGDRDDREVLIGRIKGTLLDDETIQYWRKDPRHYLRVATMAVFELVPSRFRTLTERLRQPSARAEIPAVLARRQGQYRTSAARIRGNSHSRYRRLDQFLSRGRTEGLCRRRGSGLKHDFTASNDAAIAARRGLQSLPGKSAEPGRWRFALKSAVFVERLTDNGMVTLPVSQLPDIALRQLHKDQAALKAAAHEVDPSKSAGAVVEDIRRQHPSAETLLPTAEQDLSGLRAFVSSIAS